MRLFKLLVESSQTTLKRKLELTASSVEEFRAKLLEVDGMCSPPGGLVTVEHFDRAANDYIALSTLEAVHELARIRLTPQVASPVRWRPVHSDAL
jgi:hypothetical protein